MTLKQIVATGQLLEARALVNGIRLYLTRQLAVHWGVVKQVCPGGLFFLVEEIDLQAAARLRLPFVEAVLQGGGKVCRFG